jgi:hypothetical protein
VFILARGLRIFDLSNHFTFSPTLRDPPVLLPATSFETFSKSKVAVWKIAEIPHSRLQSAFSQSTGNSDLERARSLLAGVLPSTTFNSPEIVSNGSLHMGQDYVFGFVEYTLTEEGYEVRDHPPHLSTTLIN